MALMMCDRICKNMPACRFIVRVYTEPWVIPETTGKGSDCAPPSTTDVGYILYIHLKKMGLLEVGVTCAKVFDVALNQRLYINKKTLNRLSFHCLKLLDNHVQKKG